VVAEDLLEDLLRRLMVVFRDLFERTVGGREDGDVTGVGGIQGFDDVGEGVNELGELGGVVGGGDELVDSEVAAVVEGRAVVGWAVVRRTIVRGSVVWWSVVRRSMVGWSIMRRSMVRRVIMISRTMMRRLLRSLRRTMMFMVILSSKAIK